jgi:DNA-directed RNA polymerase subunit alpha
MSQMLEIDLRDIILSNASFGPREIKVILNAITEDYQQFGVLRDIAAQLAQDENRTPATAVKLGVSYYILGQYKQAIDVLSHADSGAVAFFYMGKSYYAIGEYDAAIKNYESAAQGGYDKDFCGLGIAEVKRNAKDLAGAMRILDDMFGPVEQTAEYLYQRGATIAAVGDNPMEAIALYERAVDIDDRHAGALFGLALENDRRGNDDRAIELYRRASSTFPSHVGTLLNLGLLYEDHGQYEQAHRCYQRILEVFPNHPQARLYYRDASGAGDEWDYSKIKEEERIRQVLKTPIADFELSVRSRNCLQKMGIYTLGDLTRISETELLASKNFGETSLVEIRDMMVNKGLRVGQYAHEAREDEDPVDTSNLSPDEQAVLDRPISDLNLSVRARKCMNRLSMSTIGELIRKSADEMLECKNFGVTSLNEVREKLELLGVKLRGD